MEENIKPILKDEAAKDRDSERKRQIVLLTKKINAILKASYITGGYVTINFKEISTFNIDVIFAVFKNFRNNDWIIKEWHDAKENQSYITFS